MALCVVLDTNIWLKHPMLRSPLGAALLHTIVCANGQIGLPEVVEQELLRHAVKQSSRLVSEIQARLDKLRALAGSAPEVALPDATTLHDRAEQRLHELRKILRRVPFTFEHAKGALQRVLDGTPPNGPKNQQFKDSLIWEASMELARENEVHFVSSDKGFFRDRQLCDQLAGELQRECQQVGFALKIYPSLRDCLEAIRGEVPSFNELPFLDALRDWAFDFGEPYANERAFEVVDIGNPDCRFFVTADVDTLAAEFEIRLQLADWSPDGRRKEANLRISGEAMCSLSKEQCVDISPRVVEFEWIEPDGTYERPSILFFSTAASKMTSRDLPFLMREPLE